MRRVLTTMLFAGALRGRIAGAARAGRRRLQAGAELAEAAGRDVLRIEGRAAAAGRARRAGRGAPRERRAAARAAAQNANGAGPTNQPGISGLAIDQHDHIYVFNRGAKPVMVFDTDGNLILSGADQEINGKTINPSWQHSGGVDWDGNVYVIERDAHRIVKLSPKLDKFLLQLGTTEREGQRRDAPRPAVGHRDPAQRQHDRHRRLRQQPRHPVRQDRQVHQAGRQGRGRSGRQGHRARANGTCRTSSPSTRRRTSTSSTAKATASQVFDKNLNYIREITQRLEPVGHQHLAQGHRRHRLHRRSQGRARAQVRSEGRQDHSRRGASRDWGPGEFDWVHGIVVDSKGAVYAADTYGQRIQKFVRSRQIAQADSTAAIITKRHEGHEAARKARTRTISFRVLRVLRVDSCVMTSNGHRHEQQRRDQQSDASSGSAAAPGTGRTDRSSGSRRRRDFLDDHAAVGAPNRQRIGIDHQAVEPAQRPRVGRHAAAQAVDAHGGPAMNSTDSGRTSRPSTHSTTRSAKGPGIDSSRSFSQLGSLATSARTIRRARR